MALVRKTDEHGAASAATLGGSLRWDSALAGVDLSLKTELAGAGGLPLLGLDLSLGLLDKGKLESPVCATGGLRVEFPFGRGASLELDASLPDKGIILAPSKEETRNFPLVLCLRYRSLVSGILPSAKRRPRSRRGDAHASRLSAADGSVKGRHDGAQFFGGAGNSRHYARALEGIVGLSPDSENRATRFLEEEEGGADVVGA